jgi:hypothetical protein
VRLDSQTSEETADKISDLVSNFDHVDRFEVMHDITPGEASHPRPPGSWQILRGMRRSGSSLETLIISVSGGPAEFCKLAKHSRSLSTLYIGTAERPACLSIDFRRAMASALPHLSNLRSLCLRPDCKRTTELDATRALLSLSSCPSSESLFFGVDDDHSVRQLYKVAESLVCSNSATESS